MSERKTIDARSSFCPGPLMELISAIKLSEIGDEIEVWSSDKGSIKDIPEWIAKVGHEYIETVEHDGYAALIVKKAK